MHLSSGGVFLTPCNNKGRGHLLRARAFYKPQTLGTHPRSTSNNDVSALLSSRPAPRKLSNISFLQQDNAESWGRCQENTSSKVGGALDRNATRPIFLAFRDFECPAGTAQGSAVLQTCITKNARKDPEKTLNVNQSNTRVRTLLPHGRRKVCLAFLEIDLSSFLRPSSLSSPSFQMA